MKTQKIKLTELRQLVRKVIKEAYMENDEYTSIDNQLKNANSLEEIDKILGDNNITKGDLMKIAYDGNTRNVDSAVPMGYWEKMKPYGGTFYFVMDYQTKGGRLVHLGEKILGIDTDWEEKLNMNESVKPKTQKIKLTELRQLVRKVIKEEQSKNK